MIRVKYLCKWISYFLTFILAFGLSSVSLAQGTTYQIQALAWNPSGTLLAAGGESVNGFGIWFYNVNGQLVDQIDVFGNVFSVSWSPDGTKIAARTGGDPEEFNVWDVNTKNLLISFEAPTTSTDRFVYWNPAGTRIATVTSANIQVRNSTSGAVISTLVSPDNASVVSVAWSLDGTKIFVASENGVVRIWSASTFAILNTFNISSSLNSMALSPDGTKIAVGIGASLVQVHNAQNGALQTSFQGSDTPGPGGYVAYLKWHPNGNQIAAASFVNIKIWDLTTSTSVVVFPQLTISRPEAMDYNLNGKFAFISGAGTPSIITPQSPTGLLGQYFDNIDLTNFKWPTPAKIE